MMELTPVGLNMFITASTDSLFIPCSQPGGAKLCDQHETIPENQYKFLKIQTTVPLRKE